MKKGSISIFIAFLLLMTFSLSPGPASASPFGEIPWSSQEIILFLLIITVLLAAGAFLVIFLLKRRKIPNLLARAAAAFEQEKLIRAHKIYAHAIKRLKLKESLSPQETGWLQQAHMGLAAVFEGTEQMEEAAQQYVAAHEAGLTPNQFPVHGLILLAQTLAAVIDTSKTAVEVYLTYLDLRLAPHRARKVYLLLERLGTFPQADLRTPPATEDIAQIARIASKVAASDPNRMWAFLSLGIAATLKKEYDAALPSLIQATRLAPDCAASYYWLGQACRFKEKPHIQGTQKAFRKFLDLSKSDEEKSKRAETSFYLGAAVVADFPPSWEDPPQLTPDQKSHLGEAAHWLTRAITEGKVDGETYYSLGQANFLRGSIRETIDALQGAVVHEPVRADYHFALGMVFLTARQQQAAEEALLKAIQIDQGYREARRVLAYLFMEDRRYEEAQLQLESLLALTGPQYETLGMLLLALYRLEKYDLMVSRARDFRVYARQPEAYPLVFIAGRAHSLTSDFPGAVEWYHEALSLQAQPDCSYYLGCALGHLGRYPEALEALKPVSETDNDLLATALLQKGHILFKMGNYDFAQTAYAQALELQPEDAEVLYALGAAAYHAGDVAGASAFFNRCLDVQPSHTRALLGEALVREAQGNLDGAREHYEKVIELDPQNQLAQERLAIILCLQGDYRQSLQHFVSMEDKATEQDQSLYYLGFALLYETELSLAVKMWSKLAARHAEDEDLSKLLAQGWYLSGVKCIQEGRFPEALELWRSYLERCPDDQDTKKGLAELCWRVALASLGEKEPAFAEAKELLQQAEQLNEEHWKYPYYLALVNLAAGDRETALAGLEALARKYPESNRFLYHLGLVFLLLGDPEQATTNWKKAAAQVEGEEVYSHYALLALANERIREGDYHQASDLLGEVWKQEAAALCEESRQ